MSGRFSGFINGTEMVSFSGFCRAIGWLIAILALTGVDCFLLIIGGQQAVLDKKGNEALTIGLQIAITVLGGLLGASAVGAFNTKTIRESAKEYKEVAEAKERGKAQGHAGGSVMHADKVEHVDLSPPKEPEPPGPIWAGAQRDEGLL